MAKDRPLIGFDRFIQWEWAEVALELAYQNKSTNEVKEYLGTQISGKDSTRKTYNLLVNLWYEIYPNTETLRRRALEIYPEILATEHLILHWGIALASFPFFHNVVTTMGRLT